MGDGGPLDSEKRPEYLKLILIIGGCHVFLVSACLAGINCRYDGKNTKIAEIERLVKDGKAIAICPEVIAGLNIPRDSCEIVIADNGAKKVITKDHKDFTEA